MPVHNATTTASKLSTKRRLSDGNGIYDNNSEPRPIKKRRMANKRIANLTHPRMLRIGLPPMLLPPRVERPTWILHKVLQTTDLNLSESRLLLTKKVVESSPLLGLLTSAECESVCEKGLTVRAFDWLGREYCMLFRFLRSNRAYRLIGQWSQFLRQHAGEIRAGDAIEIWGFRILKGEGRTEFGMALLHYGKEKEEETEVCDKRNYEQPKERDGMKEERDRMEEERDGMMEERDGMKEKRDGMKEERDGMKEKRDGMEKGRERDGMEKGRERDGMEEEREGMEEERDGMEKGRERDGMEEDEWTAVAGLLLLRGK